MSYPKVCVVMSTYNGEKYLKEQIDSLYNQQGVNISIFARDDGSSDSTLSILKEYEKKGLMVCRGNNIGAKSSFLEALKKAPDSDYYAFCDQDDVWKNNKLIKAIEKIDDSESLHKPALYCGEVEFVDRNLRRLNTRSLANVKNHAFLRGERKSTAGCTMVFNTYLRQIICEHDPVNYSMHDSWIQNVCMAIDGTIYYDKTPYILYRQHEKNTVGGTKNIIQSLIRRINFNKKIGKKFYTRMYLEILQTYHDIMPKSNINRCEFVCSYSKSIKNKIALLFDKDFLRGRAHWKVEMILLIITNRF